MFQSEFTFDEFGFSSQLVRDLVAERPQIAPFTGDFFSLDGVLNQSKKKQLTYEQRELLVNALQEQNKAVSLSKLTANNIEALREEETFTITTGHQLNLLTGPLYSIYKVAQIISICNEMNQRQSAKRFVPVFWMATEDHDFDEINHIHLFGQKMAWEKTGQESKIVGEIIPDAMDDFLEAILEKYKDEGLKAELKTFTAVYENSVNLAEATRQIMNRLFADYGLVIIDGNDAALKTSFAPVAKKEIKEGFTFKAVTETNGELNEAGYHAQVYVRECNLFYIDDSGKRLRIAKTGDDRFEIDGKEWSQTDLINAVDQKPQQFSPNALLRPVYQETILPNLAYIGGGGEIAYWLQLKSTFEALNLSFPLLRVRDSIVLLRSKEINELSELGFTIPELKQDVQHLVKSIALNDTEVALELKDEQELVLAIKDKVLEKAVQINKGLTGMIEAEFVKIRKSVERLEEKMIKAEKGKHEQKAAKIKKLQGKIYPNGGFQERFENFLPYYLADETFVAKVIKTLKPSDVPLIHISEL